MSTYSIGDRVVALYPNTAWGIGVVAEVSTDPALKRYTVRRLTDSAVGHFHADQITSATDHAAANESALAHLRRADGFITTNGATCGPNVVVAVDAFAITLIGNSRDVVIAHAYDDLFDVCTYPAGAWYGEAAPLTAQVAHGPAAAAALAVELI